ncbi:MAG: sporulation integral membrane protein YtvI [Clostridiales bacterium]|jgi:sporulation integral membrane protein YtvI|nr:sporulation integral membrane protein YtvI [Clostridiales bacterium]
MPNIYTTHKARIDTALFVLGTVVFIYIFITYLYSFFAPFIVGLILSLVAEPLARFLNSRFRLSRGVAAGLCLLVLIIALSLLSATIVNKIINEARSFVYAIPYYVSQMSSILNGIVKNMEAFTAIVPEWLWLVIEKTDYVTILSSGLGAGVKSGSWNIVTNIPGFMMTFLLSFVSTFFFIRDREAIFGQIKSHIPVWLASHLAIVKKGLAYAIWGYFKAQLIIMSIVACVLIIGLLITGYPYALFIGLLIAVIDALPIFGSGSVLWPWAAFCFINGNIVTGVKLIVIYLVILITRQSLEPRIVGSQIGVHPLLTLMAMFIGLKLFGVPGLILGPAIVISVKAVYESRKKVEKEILEKEILDDRNIR